MVPSADSALNSSRLWTEEIDINGHRLEMEVALVNRSMRDVLKDLRGKFRQGAAAMNSNSMLFEVPLPSGARKRYYLVALKGIAPVLQFTMILPRDFRKNRSAGWHPEFPLPSGAVPETVMKFFKRNSIYGLFHSPFPPQQVLMDVAGELQNRGWQSAGRQSASSVQATGEIFLREKSREIMIVSVQTAASGSGSSGSMYWRKLQEK